MASKRILIVDDEENIGRSLRLILEREGLCRQRLPVVANSARIPMRERADAYLFDVTAARRQRHRSAAVA